MHQCRRWAGRGGATTLEHWVRPFDWSYKTSHTKSVCHLSATTSYIEVFNWLLASSVLSGKRGGAAEGVDRWVCSKTCVFTLLWIGFTHLVQRTARSNRRRRRCVEFSNHPCSGQATSSAAMQTICCSASKILNVRLISWLVFMKSKAWVNCSVWERQPVGGLRWNWAEDVIVTSSVIRRLLQAGTW